MTFDFKNVNNNYEIFWTKKDLLEKYEKLKNTKTNYLYSPKIKKLEVEQNVLV
jgi:hypothetical protein